MADMTKEWAERIARIKKIRLCHANFDRVQSAIRTCITLSKYGSPMHIVLTGPTGVGKTVLCRSLIQEYHKDPIISDGYRRRRVGGFYAQLGSPISIAAIMQAILRSLGDPFPLTGSYGSREGRIFTLLDTAETELIILDEFHHLEAEGGAWTDPKNSNEVINWLKWLLDELKCPLVLAGTAKVAALVRGDGQLSRRMEKSLEMYHLPVYAPETDSGTPGDFCSYSDQYALEVSKACEVTFTFKPTDDHVRMLILAATGGNPSAIASLHRLAIMSSVTKRSDGKVTMDDLLNAADEEVFEGFMATSRNPFRMDQATVVQELKERGIIDDALVA